MSADLQGRLQTQHSNVSRINHVVIRKDVFDEIVENHKPYYVWTSRDDVTHEISYDDIMSEMSIFYAEMTAYNAGTDYMARIGIKDFAVFNTKNTYISSLLASDPVDNSHMILASAVLVQMIADGATEDEVYAVVDNAVQMAIVKDFVRATNRQWAMPGHAGQDADTEPHCLLASITIEIAERMEEKFNEEYEE